MLLLVLGLLLFFSVHLLPVFASLRQGVIARMGQPGYMMMFTLAALIGFGMIVAGKWHAKTFDLWDPPIWAILVPVVIMPIVFIFLVSAYVPSNIRRKLRHPMLIGILLWSVAHLSINGDMVSVILFGSFALFSAIDLWSNFNRVGKEEVGPYSVIRDLLVVLLGLFLFLVVLYFHNTLFGISTFSAS